MVLLDPMVVEVVVVVLLDPMEVVVVVLLDQAVVEEEVLLDKVVEAAALLDMEEVVMEITETSRSCLLILKPTKLIMIIRVV